MANDDIINVPAITAARSNSNEFDVAVSAMLIGLGGERYVDIFRLKNIGQATLVELTDEDLIKLGVDDQNIRTRLLEEIQNLPLYQEFQSARPQQNLTPLEIADILEENSQHLHRIYLSMIANSLSIKKAKCPKDILVYKDKCTSDVALATLSEINTILNSMDIALHTQFKDLTDDSCKMKKKYIVGTVGSIVIAVLAVFFVQSLRQLKK